MTRIVAILAMFIVALSSSADAPLRVFIRAGEKTHGPGQHDAPQFLKDWKPLLESRGATVDGALTFPTPAQLDNTDVLIIFCQYGAGIKGEQRASLEKFLKRGGGLVVLHDGVAGYEPDWFKTVAGGAWEYGRSKFFEGKISLYYQDHEHPITRGASNFDVDDEMYWDLQLMPDAHVLAGTYQPDARNTINGKQFPSIYDIVPMMWTYERDNHRAFVSLLGHNYKTFNLPHYRAVLLRAIAWVGKRAPDSLVTKEELATLRYPEGGPTAPEIAASQFIVHPDFEVNLVASEPLIQKPISVDWDAQGRLWVAETPEYPAGRQPYESRSPRDRISILEDTNGDGRMDKRSVFAEGLELVTSFVFYRDGVIVAQAPDIFWLRDTNHDGKAETKIPLYTGFGTFDRHAVVSNMRWGIDGWIYATLGYSRGHVKSADGKNDFGDLMSGVIRFKPDASALEQVASKNGNTWGVDIAPDGEVFFSQANGAHINHVVVPEPDLARAHVGNTTSYTQIEDHDRVVPPREYVQQAYQQIDFVGGFTGASGCCIYNGGAWPEKYNYTVFVCEPTVNIVHQDFVQPDGVTFTATKERKQEFLGSTDLWFRPIHARIGPDGALYILDFYNQAIVHNDPRGPRHGPGNAAIRPDRDHQLGRIWRVQHKQAHPVPHPVLDANRPAELVQALQSSNDWVRSTAHRLLVEKPRQPEPAATDLVTLTVSGPSEARVRAYWTAAQLRALNETMLSIALTDDDAAVHRNGLLIAANFAPNIYAETMRHLRASLNAPPRVRLQALLTLARCRVDKEIAKQVANIYAGLQDPWSQSAAVEVASNDPRLFVQAAFELKETEKLTNWVKQLGVHVASKQDATLAADCVRFAASADPELAQPFIFELARGLKPEVIPALSSDLQHALGTLLNSTNIDLAAAALPLVARWDKNDQTKTGPIREHLLHVLNDANQSNDRRAQAVTVLLTVAPADQTVLNATVRLINTNTAIALQKSAIEALGTTSNAAPVLISSYAQADSQIQTEIVAQILRRPEWTLQLVEALEQGKISHTLLDPHSVYHLRKYPNPEVAKRANAFLDRVRGPQAKEKDALIAKFAPQIANGGNTADGHAAFLKNCAVCHTLNGEGANLGPNLTGIGAHGRAEVLVHVLDPNRIVDPNFIATSIETKDGEQFEGIIARENDKSIVLRNQTAEREIARADIKSKRSTGRSLMPEGFEALGAETLRNILAYICDPKTVAARK